MRLTIILLFCGLFYMGNNAYSQTITLNAKNLSLEKVLNAVQKQTGYRVSGKLELIQSGAKVTIKSDKMPLDDFLKEVMKNQILNYKVVDKNIILSSKIGGFLNDRSKVIPIKVGARIMGDALGEQEQMLIKVTGKVLDEHGEPLSGANLILKEFPEKSAISDIKGDFVIYAAVGNTLRLSHISYLGKELKITSKQLTEGFDIMLSLRNSDLKEVEINKGYYTDSKKLNTGSVSSITAKDIENQPVSNLLQALQSRIPGLSIIQQSGNPGSNFTIQIRGQNSLTRSDPLFIVDGVPFNMEALGQMGGDAVTFLGGNVFAAGSSSAAGTAGLSPLNSINPADIERVDVLKDADATAIYGSRGANGVVLITTKKGRSGPLSVNASFSSGYSNPSRMPEYMNTTEYLRYRRLLLKNDNVQVPGPTDYDLNGTWDTTRYTRWGKDLIGKPNTNRNGRLGFSGGNQQTQFQIGLGFNESKPPYKGNFSDQRTSLNFSINNSSLDKKFTIGLNGAYSYNVNNLPGLDVSSFVNLVPNGPELLNPDGTLNWWHPTASNPYASLLKKYKATTRNVQMNGNIGYRISPSLVIRSTLGFTDVVFNEIRTNPSTASNPGSGTPIPNTLNGYRGTTSWIVEPQAEFSHEFLGGKVSVLIGTTFQHSLLEGQNTIATGFSSDEYLQNIGAATKFVVKNSYTKYRYAAIFGRLNYSFKDRYVINFTGRRDGSSRFGPATQFGNFGAIGAAWVFSDETWIARNLPVLSLGKLRGSYGITGNDQIGDYRYLDSYTPTSTFTYLGSGGLLPSRLFNANYGWESNRKLEIAAELGFFKDRVILTSAYYSNRSSNQLVDLPLASTAGYPSVQENLPATIGNTGYELEMMSTNIKGKTFSWRTNFNITFSRTKLIAFPGIENSSYKERYVVGMPLGISALMYHMSGVNAQTGLYEFLALDGKLTSAPVLVDQYIRVDLTPKYQGGMGNSFQYKDFQLDVQFQFVKQTGRSGFLTSIMPFTNYANMPSYWVDKIWTKPGDIAMFQRPSAGGLFNAAPGIANIAASNSDGQFVDASYIRCKNVSLTWLIKNDWVNRLRIKRASVYAQAQNLFTITNYPGFDPESQGVVLPPLRTIVLGLQISI